MPIVAEIDVTNDEGMVSVPVGVYTKLVTDSTLLGVVKRMLTTDEGTYIKVDDILEAIGLSKERNAHE